MNDTFWVGIYPGLDHEMLDHIAAELEEADAVSEPERSGRGAQPPPGVRRKA